MLKIGYNPLHERRRVDKPHNPRAQDQRGDQVIGLMNFRVDRDIADAFPRQ